MALFSERYGYKKVSDVIIRERITPEIKNAICTCFDKLNNIFELAGYIYSTSLCIELEKHIWTNFLNQRLAYFERLHYVPTDYIEKYDTKWYILLLIYYFHQPSDICFQQYQLCTGRQWRRHCTDCIFKFCL